MPLIINTHGKLVEVQYTSSERLLLALKNLKKKNEQRVKDAEVKLNEAMKNK